MVFHCLYDKRVSPQSLLDHPKNRNKHSTEQIARLAKILQFQGWRYAIKVSKRSGFITSGHGRKLAALHMGWDEVPVVYQNYDSEEQEYADVQADNAIASWAELDLAGINSDMLDLGPDFDLELLGIKDFVLEPAEKFEPKADEDDVPSLGSYESRCKVGDVWRLGRHRLMCGDSTSIDAVDKLLGSQIVDMVFTDPPYGMRLDTDYSSMGGTGKTHQPVIGDNDDFSSELISTVFASAPHAKEIFMWGADYYSDHIPDKNDGSWFVWDKRSNKDEIGKMDGQFGSAFELCWSKSRHKREIIRFSRPTSFFRGDEASVHPTQKPVSVIEWFFDRYKGDNVLDLYGGSGSTLIACEKTGRNCYMMELSVEYCDTIIKRWEVYTGLTAERIDG